MILHWLLAIPSTQDYQPLSAIISISRKRPAKLGCTHAGTKRHAPSDLVQGWVAHSMRPHNQPLKVSATGKGRKPVKAWNSSALLNQDDNLWWQCGEALGNMQLLVDAIPMGKDTNPQKLSDDDAIKTLFGSVSHRQPNKRSIEIHHSIYADSSLYHSFRGCITLPMTISLSRLSSWTSVDQESSTAFTSP